MVLSLKSSGTSPFTIAWASPSTTADLPTPASPINTGLFFVFRHKISIIRFVSLSLPMIGSIFPRLAFSVISSPISRKTSGSFEFTSSSCFFFSSALPSSFIVFSPATLSSFPVFSTLTISLIIAC